MRDLRLTAVLTYDDVTMHDDDPESLAWFHAHVLGGGKLVLLDQGEIGDEVGRLRDVRVFEVDPERVINAAKMQARHHVRVSELTRLIREGPQCPNEGDDGYNHHVLSHLGNAFAAERVDSYSGPDRLTPAEITAFVADCPECSQRWVWIQERKAARRALSRARAVVTRHGQRLLDVAS